MAMSRYERAIIEHCSPGLISLAREMHARLFVETPIETGDLKEDAYASVDDETGEIEVGYDESNREKPHGYWVVFGTSKQEANPTIQRAVYRKYRPRRGDGL